MAIPLALVAALLFSLGTVLQQQVAATASEEEARGAGFLLRLARQPRWLAGIVADGLGFVAQALSMNFAAWGRLFDAGADLTLGQRALKRVAELLNPYFQIKSLRDFNAKFDPRWVPRAIVIEEVSQMPKVGLLYASVEGFVNLPLVGSR